MFKCVHSGEQVLVQSFSDLYVIDVCGSSLSVFFWSMLAHIGHGTRRIGSCLKGISQS